MHGKRRCATGHRGRTADLASKVSFAWVREAIAGTDTLIGLQRRNVQKGPSLDSMVLELRGWTRA